MQKRRGTPSSYKVYAGLDRLRLFPNKGQSAEPKGIRIMPYNAVNENIWNGIALVTLKKPFVFNKEVSPVCVEHVYSVPSDTSKCFASTYHSGRLNEEVVRMVPGSVCNFGHFPKLAKTKGLCSHHDRAETEKSLGGPLVCLVNEKAYQYGVYLSELITKKAFSFQKQSLHFYGAVATVFDRSPANVYRFIELGLNQKPSSSKKSSSSSEETPQQGCKQPPLINKPQKPGKPAPPPCSKPTKPTQTTPPIQQRPVYCGDTTTFGRTVESYVIGNNAQDMFPWNVIITSRIKGSTKCIGSLVHKGSYRQIVNASDVIITAADCFIKLLHQVQASISQIEAACLCQFPTIFTPEKLRYTPASAKSKLRVYANSPRFSRLKRRGIKVKIAEVSLYGLPWGNKETRRGIAILKLERPLSRTDNVVPVCLAERDSVPPPSASCYVTHYDKREHRMDEEIVMIPRNAHCLAAGSKASEYRGVCAMEEKKKQYIQLGSPMVCLVQGRVYQYGVYLNQLSLKINEKVKQNLGFYSEINVAHDVFSGRKVQTLPENVAHPPGAKPHKPIRASSSSSSSSSSASRETHRRRLSQIPDVYI
ncbi:hypothetical protein M513_13638, partial [Trichuris suis]